MDDFSFASQDEAAAPPPAEQQQQQAAGDAAAAAPAPGTTSSAPPPNSQPTSTPSSPTAAAAAAKQPRFSLRAAGTLPSCGSEVLSLKYSPDGKFLVAGCGSGYLRVFNRLTGTLLTPSEMHMFADAAPAPWEVHPATGASVSGDAATAAAASAAAAAATAGASAAAGAPAGGTSSASAAAPAAPRITLNPKLVRTPTVKEVDTMMMPCTSIAFRPDANGTMTANVLLAGYADGTIQHWHAPSGKRLSKFALAEIASASGGGTAPAGGFGLEVLSVAYAPTGGTFAAGASDGRIRLFSEETRQLISVLQPGVGFGTQQSGGHSGRVFSLKFLKDDDNMLVSAGWDNCVHLWDIRQARTTMTIFGPHVCGDAMDVTGTTLATGSCRNSDQMQLWDLRTGKVMEQVSWGGLSAGGGADTACRLYAASISHSSATEGRFLAAGGGDGANEARVYQLTNGHLTNDGLIGSLLGLSAGVLSLDFTPEGTTLAIGLANGTIHVVDIVPESSAREKKIIMF